VNTYIRRGVVALTALGTVVGSLAMGTAPALAEPVVQPSAPSHNCATGWTAVTVASTDLCEKRFSADGTMTVPAGVTSMQFLVVGGGGGGGGGVNDTTYDYYGAGSGGGGGEVKTCTETVSDTDSWTVTVGTGGSAGTSRTDSLSLPASGYGSNGGESSIVRADPAADCTAAGGQGGGEADGQVQSGPSRVVHARRFVSGGWDGVSTPTPGTGGASGSANAGGNGLAIIPYSDLTSNGGGGGGTGTGALGGDASGNVGGAGGDGTYPTGWFADFSDGLGGGGGGGSVLGGGGAGYAGGGNGTTCDGSAIPTCSGGFEASSVANAPTANSGGGGGGAAADGGAAAGAAGIVIARYEVSSTPPPPAEASDPGVWIERGGTPVAPGDCTAFATITAAVAAAQANDIIHVCPGLYQEPTIDVTALGDLTIKGDGKVPNDVRIDGRHVGGTSGNRIFDATGQSITFQNLTLQNGYAEGNADHKGGAAVLARIVELQHVVVRNNTVTHDASGDGNGSAISAEEANIADSTFEDNRGSTLGGAVYLSGAGASSIQNSSFFGNATHANAEIIGVTTITQGGAVYSNGPLTVADSYFIANSATRGGALAVFGTLSVTDSFLDSNYGLESAGDTAGGTIRANGSTMVTRSTFTSSYLVGGGDGLAIWTSAQLTVDSSTFSASFSQNGFNGTEPGVGAIYSTSTTANPDVSITNSTFFQNSAGNEAVLHADGSVELLYVTAVNNQNNAGANVVGALDLVATNSLFAANVDLDGGPSAGCSGTNSLSVPNSVSDEGTCASSASSITESSFGNFTYHGDSATETLELASGNPAIEAADCSLAGTVTVDQNGSTRGTTCDAGAMQYVAPDIARFCPEDGKTETIGVDTVTGQPICQLVLEASEDTQEFAVPAGVNAVDVVLVGAGGGGGGGGTDSSGTATMAGGGGGAGSVSFETNVSVTPLTSIPVTIGDGGSSGAGGDLTGTWRGSAGGPGGDTSFLGITASGGFGGTGAGEEGGTYYVGAGGSTPAGTSNDAHTGAAGAKVRTWDTNRYYTAAGAGAGAGGDGSEGVIGPRVGLYSSLSGGYGGLGFIPATAGSLFGSEKWSWSLGGYTGYSGLAVGGSGGATGVGNEDTYVFYCGIGSSLHGYTNASTGFGSAVGTYYNSGTDAGRGTGVITGVDADMVQPDGSGPCFAQPAGSFGSGGGGGAGFMPRTEDFQADGSGGNGGAVIIRYLAGPLPECGAASGTATESDGAGFHELIVTGKCQFTAPADVTSVDVVAIGGGGGGGGGGAGSSYAGGGGGGGEVTLCSAVNTGGTDPLVVEPASGGAPSYFGGAPGGKTEVVQGASTVCGAEGGLGGQNGSSGGGCCGPTVSGATRSTVAPSPFDRFIGRNVRTNGQAPDFLGNGSGDGGASGGLAGNAGGIGNISLYYTLDGTATGFSAAGGGGGGAGGTGSGKLLYSSTVPMASGDEPGNLRLSPDGTRLFVANTGSDTVKVYATADDSLVTTIDTGAGSEPWVALPSKDGSKLYVTLHGTGKVQVYETTTWSKVKEVDVGATSGPTGAALNHNGSRLYIALLGPDQIRVFDTELNELTEISDSPIDLTKFGATDPSSLSDPYDLVYNGDVSLSYGDAWEALYVSYESNANIGYVDVAPGNGTYLQQTTSVILTSSSDFPRNMALDPYGKLYVATTTGNVYRIGSVPGSGDYLAITHTIAVGSKTQSVATTGGDLYATMPDDDTLAVIDTDENGSASPFTVKNTLDTGDEPFGVIVGLDSKVYVGDRTTGGAASLTTFFKGCPQPYYTDPYTAPASTTCQPSTGGDGAVLGQLTGATSTLFSGDTRAFGGGGGGGSTHQFDGSQNALTLGGTGGGGTGGYEDNGNALPPTGGTEFGGGGGGAYNVIDNSGGGGCSPFCDGRPTTRNGAVSTEPGEGAQGAVIIRYFVAGGPPPPGAAVWIERAGVPLQVESVDTSCANPGYTTITAAVAAASADDVIHVCSGTYREAEITPTVDNLTILGEEYSAANAPQDVSTPLSPPVFIDGELTEGDATSRHRIVDAKGLKITFKNVRLRNGGVEGYGGAVKAFQVMVEDSVFNDNDAVGGGAIYVSTDGYTPPCVGPIGSLFGPTSICAPVLANPPALPLISVVGSEFTDNGTGSSINGGALYASGGTVTSNGSTFSGNEALLAQEPPLASDGAGGAILAQLVVVYGSTFTGNKALFHGGAISATTIRVFPSTESPKVASVFDSNEALGDSNSDGYGGALWADQVEVEASSFVSNLADSGGAIASAAELNTAPVTPAVPVTGTVSVTASTFETNSATVDGGAVLNKAVGGSTTVYNSTFSANHAGNAGGGVYAQDALSVSFSTFDANTADVSGGVFWTPVAPSVDNNIFSFAAADETEAVHNGCLTYEWTPAKDTTNLTTNYWCPGTVVEAPATLDLQSLADNGGPTETMAIGTSSAALDAADQTECDSRTDPSDQRGVGRPVGSACDVGAFEYYGSITLDTTPGVESELMVPTGASTLYFLLVGGGGGGAHGGGSEAGGGGGGGQVVECTVDVTDSDTVIYYFGESGIGGDGTNPATAGDNSYVKVNGDIAVGCEALGGQPGSPAAEGGNGGASGNPATPDFAGGSGATAAPLVEIVAGGGGAGAGGDGGDGSYDSVTFMATGGAGGAGKAPSSSSFGDTAVFLGGGGGGGAFICSADSSMTAGDGGVGGGGSGSTDSCVTRPIGSRGAPGGGDSSGGGGGGGAGSVSGGEGGAGGGEVRTSAPTDAAEQLHVCVKKLYVKYGASYYNPEPFLCVPEIDECAAPTSPTLTPVSGSDPECCPSPVAPSTDSSVTPSDPECCPTVTAPVDGSDPDHCGEPLVAESPFDGSSTVVNGEVVDSGLVGELTDSDLDSDGDEAPESFLPMPRPLDYEHGIPEGWRKASPDEFPGVVVPTCSTEYEPGDDVTDPADSTTWLPITCEGGDPLEYEFNYEFIDGLRIYPAVLKVKPRHLRVAFGTPEPSPYEFTIKGFKLGETADVLTDLPVCDSGYTDTAEAGSRFYIECSGGVADNYTFKYEKSHIHVQKVKVSLRAADRVVTYGDPAPDYSFGLSGLRGPDSALSPERLAGFVAPTCSTSYGPDSSPGSYEITCEGAVSTNYEFVPTRGMLTVHKATLTVAPRSASVQYGSLSPLVPFDMVGFVNGETLPGSGYSAPKCAADGYAATSPAGSRLLVSCTGGLSRNYQFELSQQSVLDVAKAPLVVVPDPKAVSYGSLVPQYTAVVTGWRNGESPLTNPAGFVMPVCGSSYAPGDNAGSVSLIVCTGGDAENYSFDTSRSAQVTVGRAPLMVTADAKSVTYGQAAPLYTSSITGFQFGQSAAVLSAQPVCVSAYTPASNAGSYAISCSGGSAGNYSLSFQAGTLTVNKAVLRAVPANASVVYGSSAPTVPATVTGFVNAQTATTAAGFKAPTCSAPGYTVATNVGVVPITCTGGSATNYTFDNTASSSLTITKATASITAASRSVVYGTVGPVFGFTVSGLKNGQTAGTVAGLVAPVCSSTYTALTNVGTVPVVSCAGASSTNYNFTYVTGKVTVTKAPLTVTPNNLSIAKGSAVPSYTFTVAGFANGQTKSVLTAQPKCTSSYTTRSAIGTYTITCSSAAAANYTITYKTGTLTVR